jgi:hypothetical protein
MSDRLALLRTCKNSVEARDLEARESRNHLTKLIREAHEAQVPVKEIALATGYTTARVYQLLGKSDG